MCGIAGIYFPRSSTAVKADMDGMLNAMVHRGPDGEGRFATPDKHYQAGFRRLAIIDLKNSSQPIVEKLGPHILMGNGEIYNYLELRKSEANYSYQSEGDMEVILPLAARHGDKFVHQLNGMFALALYNRNSHRLMLIRDRIGVKSLYWSRLPNGGIIFASEIKALFASGLVSAAIDEEAVSAYLAHGYVPAPQTLFRGISKLPPAHTLTADDAGNLTIERYWRAGPASNTPDTKEETEIHLTELLRDSVRLQLRSDVPVGALLSGGVDSGLLVALAAEQSSHPVNTYTVSFEGAEVDEGPLAKAIADRYGTNHTALNLPADDICQYLPMLAWHMEEPLNDAAVFPNYLIEKALSKSVTVALNGTGGDELFAGYGRYFQLPVEARFLSLPRPLRAIAINLTKIVDPMTAWQLSRAEKLYGDGGNYLHEHSTHFPPPLRAKIGNRQIPPEAAQAKAFEEFLGEAQTRALYADLNTYLPDDLLFLLDRTSMSVSVEGRVPFLDHRLVEAALAVPTSIRTPANQQKGLERSLAEAFLPKAVTEAPKQGFMSPVPAWIRSGLGPLARQILTTRQSLERGWWTADGIDWLLANPERHGFRVYSLLMLELTILIHVESSRSPTAPLDGLEAFAHAA
jgi:asparagine synthase (glutamine-hydrolysing)